MAAVDNNSRRTAVFTPRFGAMSECAWRLPQTSSTQR